MANLTVEGDFPNFRGYHFGKHSIIDSTQGLLTVYKIDTIMEY